MNRSDFKRLADTRIRDAVALMQGRRYAGAYYLAGYAVECGLKACIAKQTRRHEFPDKELVNQSYTHGLEKLINTAGLKNRRDADAALDPLFGSNWAVAKDWSELARYQTQLRSEAIDLLTAITAPVHGVMQWSRRHW